MAACTDRTAGATSASHQSTVDTDSATRPHPDSPTSDPARSTAVDLDSDPDSTARRCLAHRTRT